MMSFNFTNDTAYLEAYVKLAIRFFMDLMIDKRILAFKTGLLNINIEETSKKSDANLTFNGSFYEVNFKINVNDDLGYILFVIGHEIGHFVLLPVMNSSRPNYCKSDKSWSVTTITRRTKKDKGEYGTVFEEAFCNWCSYNFLTSVLGDDFKVSSTLQRSINLCQRIVDSFEVCEYSYWDDLLYEGALYECNSFLYGVTRMDISNVIYRYDKAMGYGSWKKLMGLVRDYVYSDSAGMDRLDIKINNILSCFKKANVASVKAEVIAS